MLTTPFLNWTVKETLQARPQAARTFMDLKLGCVGCSFSKFCTLQEVVEIYSLDSQTFFTALAIGSPPTTDHPEPKNFQGLEPHSANHEGRADL